MQNKLFQPLTIGNITLANRIVMAPMTRCRAAAGEVPTNLMAEYYAQRASAGLIVTEATQVSQQGQGYPSTPGIFTPAQIAGWKLVTNAVHKEGGLIFNQLWHVGRVSHPAYQPEGAAPVAPSAIALSSQIRTPEGMKDAVVPRALEVHEIPGIVEQYQNGARAALEAGFDGVEIHGANGYLLDQFLRDGANKRTDAYGGSIENRSRLLLEVVDALCQVWPSSQIGIRLSPVGTFNDMSDSNPQALYSYVLTELAKRSPGYVHIVEAMRDDFSRNVQNLPREFYRKHFDGIIIINSGYTKNSAEEILLSGQVDLVSIGVPFIANPDLVNRYRLNAELNEPDPSSFYGGDEKGYTDYPALPG